jgi:hypothetical protein
LAIIARAGQQTLAISPHDHGAKFVNTEEPEASADSFLRIKDWTAIVKLDRQGDHREKGRSSDEAEE